MDSNHPLIAHDFRSSVCSGIGVSMTLTEWFHERLTELGFPAEELAFLLSSESQFKSHLEYSDAQSRLDFPSIDAAIEAAEKCFNRWRELHDALVEQVTRFIKDHEIEDEDIQSYVNLMESLNNRRFEHKWRDHQ